MSIRRRTYPEVLENVLTGLVQGVAAEAHPFPPSDAPPFAHVLERSPVAAIISVYGSRNGQPFRFTENTDYVLANGQSLVWQNEGGQLPDAGTLVTVNYTPQSAQGNQTDIYPGSVLRTLVETVALEISRLYAQLEAVYQSAYIDTASGSSLDKVVALLGVERVTGNHPAGEVVFTRAGGSRGAITIPAGTRITTVTGDVEYATTTTVTMLDNQNTARVPARDLETTNDPLAADLLTLLPIPIAGIASVTNPNPTSITTQAESDDELRARAKNVLVGSERATVAALRQAVERQGVSAEIVEDPAQPGIIAVNTFTDQMSPELLQRIRTALADARPAGVFVKEPDVQTPAKVGLQIRLTTVSGLVPADLRAVQEKVRAAVADYFAKLPAKANASLSKITGLVMAVPGVEDMRLLAATRDGASLDIGGPELDLANQATVLDVLQLADPALPSQLSATITFAATTAAPDEQAVRSALAATFDYLNQLNQTELAPGAPAAEQEKRVLSYGKLLLAIPLPGKAATPLQSYDAAPNPALLPTGGGDYGVTFAITMPSGLSQLLAAPGDAYTLTPFERLSLNSVTLAVEAANG